MGVRIRQFTHTRVSIEDLYVLEAHSLNYLPRPGAFGDNLTLSGLDLSSCFVLERTGWDGWTF